MEITSEDIARILDDFWTRCAQHRAVGLSLRDHVDGEPVPDGWMFQPDTCYFIPPHVNFTVQ